MADIFVSYARRDKGAVAPLVAALEAEGWSVWWDPAITPGEEFDSLIARELERARALVVVWTPSSVESRWVRGEAREAADRGVLVPVRLQNARMPIDFRALHTIDLDDWGGNTRSDVFRSLCGALEAKLGAPARPHAGAPSAPAPSAKAPAFSICVLPFGNMSGDPEQEYFSDGITEDIITDLGKVSALSIVSRNLAFSFKGARGGVREIGRQTDASHVLVGSVRKAGPRVRITAQLVQAANESQIWGERYDRDLTDIFALQDEISKAIVAALKLTLMPEERRALEQRATKNVSAYKYALMARQFSVMGNERHQQAIVRLCRRAVELDPGYAAPWAMMAMAQADMFGRRAIDDDGLTAAQTAIHVDPKLALAHAALGAAMQSAGRYEEGLRASQAALQLEPESYDANRVAGMCCMALKRLDDAIRYFEAAAASIDTEFTAASFAMQMYEAKGDREAAMAAARQALVRVEKVIAVEPDHGRALGYGAGILATLGEADRAKEWIERGALLDPDNVTLLYNFVCALARLGALEDAVELLARFIDQCSEGTLRWLDSDPDMDPLRDNPRYCELVSRTRARYA